VNKSRLTCATCGLSSNPGGMAQHVKFHPGHVVAPAEKAA
jgi:hypothetical protein